VAGRVRPQRPLGAGVWISDGAAEAAGASGQVSASGAVRSAEGAGHPLSSRTGARAAGEAV